MSVKPSAQDVDFERYINTLRDNVALAELVLMQFSAVAKHLEDRESLTVALRVNLEVQERVLKDMLVLSIARLFDLKNGKLDQLSIPNIHDSKKIKLNDYQIKEIKRLQSLATVKKIRTIRTKMVAHSLSHAADEQLQASDFMHIIDGCYKILADVHTCNRISEVLVRTDISEFSAKWSEMTQSWR
jgi:hypothetical protein